MRTEKNLYKTEIDRWVDIQRTQREEWAKAHDIREEEIDKKEPGLTEKDYCPGCHQPYFIMCHSTKEGWETWQGLCPYCAVRFLNSNKIWGV